MACRSIPGAIALALCAAIGGSSPAFAACFGVEAYAHRGHPSKPENSAAALALGRIDGFDGPEFDIAALSDGSFAITHDAFPGRAVKGAPRKFVRDISPSEWSKATLAGRKGEITKEPAALLDDALPLLAKSLAKGGKAVVEIKAATCEQASRVAGRLDGGLPPGSLMIYSLKPDLARCAAEGLRPGSKSGAGIGFAPSPETLQRENPRAAALAKLAAAKGGVSVAKAYATAAGGSGYSAEALREAAKLPRPWAMIDAEDLRAEPSILIEAKRLGVSLIAYGRLGDAEMASALSSARSATGLLPSGASLDSLPSERFCPALSRGAGR